MRAAVCKQLRYSPSSLHSLRSFAAILLVALFTSVALADDVITNFMSPVVSYQYQEALGTDTNSPVMSPVVSYQYYNDLGTEALTNGGIMSPIVSYQYFDSLGTNVSYQQSLPVSYFFNVPNGGNTFTLSGRVLDASGATVRGATVTASILETTHSTATTAANGTYQIPALPQGVYVFSAAKTGFARDRRVVSFGAGSTRQDFRLVPAAAPPVVQTVTTAPPFVPPASTDIEGSALLFFDGTRFVPDTTPTRLDATKMTVVLTHGWNSSPSAWAAGMATALKDKGLLPFVNIVAWDWNKAANQLLPPEEKTPKQGVALGKMLYTALGSGYLKQVHFMGHSLGAVVNAAAANYLHGDGEGRQDRASLPWSSARTHLTLFDEAELSRVVGKEVIYDTLNGYFSSGGRLSLGNPANTIFRAIKGWKSPVPQQSAWVDNYVSAVSIYHPDAVNACLLRGLLDNFGDPILAHNYSQQWYVQSIARPTASAMGFKRSFEYQLLAGGGTVSFPPPESELVIGDAFAQVLTAPDDLTLEQLPYLRILECFAPGLTYGPAIGYGSTVLELAGDARKAFNVGLDYVESAALSVYQGVNSVTEAVGNRVHHTIDLLSRFTLRITLRAGQALGIHVATRTPATVATPTNSPAYAWLPIAVPADAVLLSFEFTVLGDGKGDSLVFGINGTNLFSLETKFLADSETGSSRLIDVTSYAGKTNEFFFGLLGGTSTNCTVQVQNLKFFTLTPPQLAITQTNATTAVSWSSTLTGFSLETSDSLSPPLWQPVTNAPSLYGGTMTVTNIPSARANFFRLRRL